MRRPWQIWIGFVLCLAVVLAAMGWISVAAWRLDKDQANAQRDKQAALRQEAEARRQAAWEEKIRLALWRMDWWLAPFVAQESARPYFAYKPFLPLNRAYSAMFNDRGGGEMLIPSPLLSADSPHILVHFQFEPDGQLTSPQAPAGDNRELAVPNHVRGEAVRKAETQLARVGALVDREQLLAMLPASAPNPVEIVVSPFRQTPAQRTAQRQRRLDLQQQGGRAALEFEQRNQAIQNSTNVIAQAQQEFQFSDLSLPSTDVSGVLMTPLWIDGELILARRIAAGGQEYVQGCLLDWPAIKTLLLETVEDLFPEADLEPVTAAPVEEESQMLAALPVRFKPGRPIGDRPITALLPVNAAGSVSPIGLSLGVAWGGMLLAAVAVAALLLGVIRLSERRASFVTAVTHELRTPLTTFQMYAEMLAEGMVSDGQQQTQYLNTLRAEAVRLTHLVENVLSYARLERGRADGRLEAVTLGQLIEQIEGRLAGRARQAGMEMVVQREDAAWGATVKTNISATEQILFNLVDNACKYAACAADKRIHLTFEQDDGAVQVRLRDHGPGVSPSARRRLFHSFCKSAHEAAHTAPGVGLGLALSRRLARHMGGDLRLEEKVTEGACFVLTLSAVGGSVSE